MINPSYLRKPQRLNTAGNLVPMEAASARATTEPAGQPRSLDVATCSLPVSSVDDAAFHLSYAARMANELRRPDMADKLIAIARDLIFRADAARATERQPEENVKAEPRP